jgi:Cu-processing system permease protein
VFVIVYDLALMGLLVASKGGLGADIFPSLLLLNPADAYRLFNLTALENVRQISGMGGLAESAHFGPVVLLTALLAWIVVPLSATVLIFARREA